MTETQYKPQLTDEQAQELWEENKRWGGDTLYQKLENALCDIHTRVGCVSCTNGVRPMYSVHGMCHDCAREEIDRLREMVKS